MNLTWIPIGYGPDGAPHRWRAKAGRFELIVVGGQGSYSHLIRYRPARNAPAQEVLPFRHSRYRTVARVQRECGERLRDFAAEAAGILGEASV